MQRQGRFIELGYRNFTNLEGGTKAWKKAGFALE